MKKIILLFVVLSSCIYWSCSKDYGTGKIAFGTSFAKLADTAAYDSVSYLVIKYFDIKDMKDTSDYNSEFYTQSMTLPVKKFQGHNFHFQTEYIDLPAGHSYVVKSFELTGAASKVYYYIPYTTPSGYKDEIMLFNLPLYFRVTKDYSFTQDFTIIKK